MEQIPNLDNAPLNLTSLRFGRGNKCLIVDEKLSGSLSLIVQTSILKEHGVELQHLSWEPVQTECTKVVYLIRSQLNLVKLISAHIQNDLSKGIQREYSVYFVPRRTVACEKEEKVHHLLTFGEYPLYMIPLDEDVLSFELDLAYRDYLVDGDTSALWHVAKSMHKLQILRVSNGSVELDASIMGNQRQEGKKTKVPLNSSDKLLKETRDLNFGVVLQVLHQKAKDMRQDYMEIQTANQSLSEIKIMLKKYSSLTRHINLTQHLATFTSKPSFSGKRDMGRTIVEGESYDICFEYIEEMIHKQVPIVNVLRLLVLFSVTNLGLPKKQFDYIRREFLHSYGFEHIATLCNLEKAGLFKKQEVKGNWLTIKHALNLIVEDTDTANPNDIAYAFSGWRPIEEILKLLPGPHSEIKRGGYSSTPSFDTLPGAPASIDKVADGRRSLVLAVFVGGVTFAEISALRDLNAQEGMACDSIVGTTKMVNGNTIIETFMENWKPLVKLKLHKTVYRYVTLCFPISLVE
ncbi:hypothetical protein MKW92_022559 [Papaver armeniacum]|nr:hypothetical protein MKW92_022559 [Papaver armeniacum]